MLGSGGLRFEDSFLVGIRKEDWLGENCVLSSWRPSIIPSMILLQQRPPAVSFLLNRTDTMTELSASHETDPCLAQPSFSPERFALFLPIFLTMTVGSGVLFVYLAERPFGIQIAAMVCYTSAIVLYTFSANRGLPRYLFGCPLVRAQFPRLVQRHIVFLPVLITILTAAFQLRPQLPASWLIASGERNSMPPFTIVLFILSALLAFVQILTNRSLLDRAHRDVETP
jgi:hypothetical protein